MTIFLCFLGYFPNDAALKFDIVSVAFLYVSYLFVCWKEAGVNFGFWGFFGLVCAMPGIDYFV